MASAVAVIPARYASSRFPGKVLASETGRPLIQHVYEQVRRARRVSQVLVAADDPRIIAAVESFGGRAVLTRADHANGTSRIAEVAAGLECDLVVNVQGDEPEIEPEIIDAAVAALENSPDCAVSTLASPMGAGEDPGDPAVVKVVLDARGRALYFSRAAIPHDREMVTGTNSAAELVPVTLRHVGLYVYRRAFLADYVRLPPGALEEIEKLEQLRILEHGYDIAVAIVDAAHAGIDTPRQYQAFVARYAARAKARQRA